MMITLINIQPHQSVSLMTNKQTGYYLHQGLQGEEKPYLFDMQDKGKLIQKGNYCILFMVWNFLNTLFYVYVSKRIATDTI